MRRNGLRDGALHNHLRQVEIEEIRAGLRRNGGNISATARELGRSRVGLTRRMQALGIRRPTRKGRQAVLGGPRSDSAPAELAIRETTLYRFTNALDRAAVLRVGRIFHLYALEQPAAKDSESAVHAALRAAAQDLRNLKGFLEWVSREGDDTELGSSDVALTEMARAWGEELERIATSMESGLGTPQRLAAMPSADAVSPRLGPQGDLGAGPLRGS